MNILKINSINQEYIHLIDNTREKTSVNKLMDILPLIKSNKDFYSRMLQECNELQNDFLNKLNNTECPDELQCQGIIGVDSLLKREDYIRKSNEFCGINNISNYAFNQYNHWYKLLNQINAVINKK